MSLRDFIILMDQQKEVLHVDDEISNRFEVSYLMKSFDDEGPILLFERVKNYSTKIVANVCGTRERVCKMLKVSPNRLYQKMTESWRSPRRSRIVDEGIEETHVKKTEVSQIPFLTHFEKDAGPYITSAIVHAKSADGKIENVSVHRFQVLGKRRMAIRLVPRHLFKLWKMAKERGEDLDAAISIGVPPAVLLAASSPLPFGVSEFDVANTLMGNSLRLTKCEHVNAYAPTDAELILEARISASKEVAEGPFVDVTGTYDVQRKQPVVEIVSIRCKKDYIYQGMLPSSAEHRLMMGLPHEVLIWEAVSKVVPKVCEVNLSLGGCGWLHAVISIEKQLDGDGKNALLAAFAAHPSLKHAVIVDSDIDVHDMSQVEWAIATRFQANEDLVVIKNARGSTLDSSADQESGLTSKVGVDATRPSIKPREKFERARIPRSKRSDELAHRLHEL